MGAAFFDEVPTPGQNRPEVGTNSRPGISHTFALIPTGTLEYCGATRRPTKKFKVVKIHQPKAANRGFSGAWNGIGGKTEG
jgi:hypothetical protein